MITVITLRPVQHRTFYIASIILQQDMQSYISIIERFLLCGMLLQADILILLQFCNIAKIFRNAYMKHFIVTLKYLCCFCKLFVLGNNFDKNWEGKQEEKNRKNILFQVILKLHIQIALHDSQTCWHEYSNLTCRFTGSLGPRYERIHVIIYIQTRPAISQPHVGVHSNDLVIRLDSSKESGSGRCRVRDLFVHVISLRYQQKIHSKTWKS